MNFRGLVCSAVIVMGGAFTLRAQDASAVNTSRLSTSDPDLLAIMRLEQRDADAAKVNDVEGLVSLWTGDGVLLQPSADPVVGVEAIRQLLERQKQQTAMVITLSYVENWKERRIGCGDAYEWGELEVTAKLPNGKEATQSVHAMRILRRQPDGSWKLARAIITPRSSKQ